MEWSEDITHLYSIFKDSVYVGIYIDTWTKEGFLVNLDIDIEVFGKKTKEISVNPIINTVYYMGQSYPDIFCRKDLEASFHIPPKAKNVRIKYIATGHGGHSGGDEFKPTEHSIYVDNSEVFRFIPWRNDCASFRRYNPSAGVWLVKRMASYIGEKGYEEKFVIKKKKQEIFELITGIASMIPLIGAVFEKIMSENSEKIYTTLKKCEILLAKDYIKIEDKIYSCSENRIFINKYRNLIISDLNDRIVEQIFLNSITRPDLLAALVNHFYVGEK